MHIAIALPARQHDIQFLQLSGSVRCFSSPIDSTNREDTTMNDESEQPHKPQFASAPGQARKTATVEDSLAAAAELRPMVGAVRRAARERRAALAKHGKMALPPEQR